MFHWQLPRLSLAKQALPVEETTASFTTVLPFCHLLGEHLTMSLLLQEIDDQYPTDRAYIYSRLLCIDPDAAQEVVLAAKPIIPKPNLRPASSPAC